MKQVINLRKCTIENVSSTLLIIAGTVFLFMALFNAWMYSLVMAVCYAAAVLIRDLKDDEHQKGK